MRAIASDVAPSGRAADMRRQVPVEFLLAGRVSEIDAALATISAKTLQGPIVGTDALCSTHREQITRLVAAYAVPAIYDSALPVAAGGRMSCGAS